MSDNQIKLGDVVQLKTGGPKMTVEGIEKNSVYCVWFYMDIQLRRETFGATALKVLPND